jgi:hypothetical protein
MDVCSTAVVVGIGLLVMPAAALAGTAPVITKGPAISGTPQEGLELVAEAEFTGDPVPTAAYAWLRCTKATGTCSAIAGAAKQRYVVSPADLGAFLRVRMKVTNAAGSATAQSKPTTVVLGAPEPTPTPTPSSTPTPTPMPEPTVAPAPTAAPQPAPAPVVTAPAPLVALAFDPFPVVRIKGVFTARGARVTLLNVAAPGDVRIDVDCMGRDCPARHYRSPRGKHRLRKFERDLRAGTRLEVRVTKPGYVGKFTSFVIRRRAEPKRADRCLAPGTTRPVTCA